MYYGEKVTIQDIADSLGLSRNTVSKALNNTGILAEETRQKILTRAAEMGYRRFIYLQQDQPEYNTAPGELALISQNMPYGSHFGTYALNTFQEKISQNNYRLTMFPVLKKRLPHCSSLLDLTEKRQPASSVWRCSSPNIWKC